MTTQHPAGDGDTRPTDRERLTEAERKTLLDLMKRIPTDHTDAAIVRHVVAIKADAYGAGLAARAPAPPDAAQAQMGEREDEAWDEFNDTTGARCCDCPSCNHYLPEHEQRRDEPCVMRVAIEKIIKARRADRLAAEPDAATRTVQVDR